jgi:hypothetical protein
MWQAEACWIAFDSPTGYPMAVKVAAGKINAVTGRPWSDALNHDEQDFFEVPAQPWLDGFCVTKGTVRQFVAMPLGRGYTAEEQITGASEFGGVQLLVRPLRGEIWEGRKCARMSEVEEFTLLRCVTLAHRTAEPVAMGLAPGGSIRQHIAEATESPRHWAPKEAQQRCFVHLVNSAEWQRLAGSAPPTQPPSAADYTRAGLPWFDWYSDQPSVDGSTMLDELQTVLQLGYAKGEKPLPENESFMPPPPVVLKQAAPVNPGSAQSW